LNARGVLRDNNKISIEDRMNNYSIGSDLPIGNLIFLVRYEVA